MPPTLSKPHYTFSQHGKHNFDILKYLWHPFSLARMEPAASATHGTYPRHWSNQHFLLDSCLFASAGTSGDDTKKAPIQCRREGLLPSVFGWFSTRCAMGRQWRHKEGSNSMSMTRFCYHRCVVGFRPEMYLWNMLWSSDDTKRVPIPCRREDLLRSMCGRLSSRDIPLGYTLEE